MENETAVGGDTSLRLFSYDEATYPTQLLTDRKTKEETGKTVPRYSVVTLVLYLGYDRHWKTLRALFECFFTPEEIKPYMNDYCMNLYKIACLSDEQVQILIRDF